MFLFGKQKQAAQRPSALDLFTDREEERSVIKRHLDGLQRIHEEPLPAILQFYGIGGIGKSTLLRKAAQESADREYFSFVSLDVDHSGISNLPATELFWGLRRSLYAAGIPTPLFDCLFVIYRAKTRPGEKVLVSDLLQDLTKSVGDVNEGTQGVLGFFDYLKEFGALAQEVSSKAQMVSKVAQFFKTRMAKAKIGDLGIDLAVLEIAELDTLAGQLLAKDILTHLADYPYQCLCIAVDGYERIQINRPEDKLEYYFQQFCGILAEASNWASDDHVRVKFILFGRNKLRWSEVFAGDPDAIGFDWADPKVRRIEHHSLGGLSESDARYFLLDQAARQFSERGMTDVAAHIQRHIEAILAAALEKPDHSGEACYYPYYLDLAVDLILKQGERFAPEMLGKSPVELQQRFLKYLGEPERKAIQTLAMALQFDKPLFQHLAAGSYLGPSYSAQDFGRLAYGNHAYIQDLEDGRFAFHRHMQQALVDSMNSSDGDRAAAADTVDAICCFYQQAVDHSPTSDAGIDAARRIADIVLTHGESGLVSLDFVSRWLLAVDSLNTEDLTDAAARLARYERYLRLFSARYDVAEPVAFPTAGECELLDQLAAFSGMLFLCVGDPASEERFSLHLQSLFDGRPFNKQMPNYMSVANTLATMYFRQGKIEEANACLLEVGGDRFNEFLSDPEILEKHFATGLMPIILSVSNLHARCGQPAEAAKCLNVLWPIVRDSNLATTIGLRLRQLYADAGQTADAEALDAELAPKLDQDHGNNTFAVRLQLLQSEATRAESCGDFSEAQRLLLEMLGMIRKTMGPRATTLIASLTALGRVMTHSDPVQACQTLEEALALAEESKVGGVARAEILYPLACALLARGDLEGRARAAELLRQSIPVMTAHYADNSAHAGQHRLQLARTLNELSRPDEALAEWLAAAECYRAMGGKYVNSYAIALVEMNSLIFSRPEFQQQGGEMLDEVVSQHLEAIAASDGLLACRLCVAYGAAMIWRMSGDEAVHWLHQALYRAQALASTPLLESTRSDALYLLGVDQERRGLPLAALKLYALCHEYLVASGGAVAEFVTADVARLTALQDELLAAEANGPNWMRPSREVVLARALAALGGRHDEALMAFNAAVAAALANEVLADAIMLGGEAFNFVANAGVMFDQATFDHYFEGLHRMASLARDQLELTQPLAAAHAYFRVARHHRFGEQFEFADSWLAGAELVLDALLAASDLSLPMDEAEALLAVVLQERALVFHGWGRSDEARKYADSAQVWCERRADIAAWLKPRVDELIGALAGA